MSSPVRVCTSYICICTCACVHLYVHLCVCVHLYVYVCVCMCTCMCMCVISLTWLMIFLSTSLTMVFAYVFLSNISKIALRLYRLYVCTGYVQVISCVQVMYRLFRVFRLPVLAQPQFNRLYFPLRLWREAASEYLNQSMHSLDVNKQHNVHQLICTTAQMLATKLMSGSSFAWSACMI